MTGNTDMLTSRLNELRIILENMIIRQLEVEASISALEVAIDDVHDINQTMLNLEEEEKLLCKILRLY